MSKSALIRITLFTRQNCSLCLDATHVLSRVWNHRPFQLRAIDIWGRGHRQWKIYDFDIPVIHVERIPDWDTGLNTETTADCARKLMHRFREEDVLKLIDDVENEAADEEDAYDDAR